MSVSHCQNMTNICSTNIYAENPFYLLGLSPFSSSRTIRRKKQDFESANTLGHKQWNNEFKHLIRQLSIPTFEKVTEAFLQLEDPLNRIIYELFWLWPLDNNNDVASNLLKLGKIEDAVQIWMYEENSNNENHALIATHNLAILYHFYAIDAEVQFIENNISASNFPRKHAQMCEYWEKALSRWEKLSNTVSFWAILKERVVEIGDQRLTSQFVQQMRDEFPLSLNRINGILAFEYAKLQDKNNEVKRHITYIKKSHQGCNHAHTILESIIEPIEREIDLMIGQANKDSAKDPRNALSVAKRLFESTQKSLNILSQIFESQNVKRCKIVDNVITMCNRCLVAYCSKTNKFEESISFLEKILPLANGVDLKKLLNENLKVFKENFEEYKLTHYCWFCQKNIPSKAASIDIHMYGDITIIPERFSRNFRATWRNITVTIPRCQHCLDESIKRGKLRNEELAKANKAIEIARNQRSGWDKFWDIETDEIKNAKKASNEIARHYDALDAKEKNRKNAYPPYDMLKKRKFDEGFKPSDWELQRLYRNQYPYGFPPHSRPYYDF